MAIWSKLFGRFTSSLPEGEIPSLEDAAGEGFAMAEQAAVMALKNRILVTAHVSQDQFDLKRYERELRDILTALAKEQEAAVALVRKERAVASTLRGRPVHQHDYRQIDLEKLRLRERSSAIIAERIRAKRGDGQWLRSMVERARDDAWAELAREMERSLDRTEETEFGGPDYEIGREDRLRKFVTVDLFRLQLDAQRSDTTEASSGVEEPDAQL